MIIIEEFKKIKEKFLFDIFKLINKDSNDKVSYKDTFHSTIYKDLPERFLNKKRLNKDICEININKLNTDELMCYDSIYVSIEKYTEIVYNNLDDTLNVKEN